MRRVLAPLLALALLAPVAAGGLGPVEDPDIDVEVSPAAARFDAPTLVALAITGLASAPGAPAPSPTTSVLLRLPLGAESDAPPEPSAGWERTSGYVRGADGRLQVEYRPAASAPTTELLLQVALAPFSAETCALENAWQIDVTVGGPATRTEVPLVCDRVAPTLATNPDILGVEATGPTGAAVTFSAPAAEDDKDDALVVDCEPSSGSLFDFGESTVTCSVSDAAGNAAPSTTFRVEVVDTTGPSIRAASDVVAEATSADGAVVTYTAPLADDVVDGTFTAACLPASGATFALGETTVRCDASDTRGNPAATTTFRVTVRDTTAPLIADAADLVAEATGPGGAAVTFPAPGATDAVDGAMTNVTCAPPSGSTFELGVATVTCDVRDAHGNAAAPESFQVEVRDTTGPVIDEAADLEAEATSASGAAVTYTAPQASDLVDGALTNVTCAPASGSTFAIGETTVTCDVSDSRANAAEPRTFTVTVRDTTAPVFEDADDVWAEATGPAGAVVEFATPEATDSVGGPLTNATCAPASGSTFPVGATTVTCRVSDAFANEATTQIVVTITDTTPPELAVAQDLTAEATGPDGASVAFDAPHASDLVDGTLTNATCSPASGATFGLGATTVTCDVRDGHGNAAEPRTFQLTVVDTTGPTIDEAPDVEAEATSASGAIVTYTTPQASDLVDGILANVTCAPASGSTFPLGETTVTCDVSDARANAAPRRTFTVTVRDTLAPVFDAVDDLEAEATAPQGAVVAFATPLARDAVDGELSNATCAPASGSTFPLGATTVTCRVVDSEAHEATVAFEVLVVDTTPPEIADAADVLAEATGPGGAVLTYDAPTALDAVDGTLANVSCSPASGATFALGDTTVTCDVSDARANAAASRSFTVTVRDTTPPVIADAADVVAEATGPEGATVAYAAPGALDAVDGALANVTCAPASGSTFPIGDTVVACGVSDARANAAEPVSFTVTVRDATPPAFDPLDDLVAEATSASGAVVAFAPLARDAVDGELSNATCAPASGSTFRLGTTSVTCSVADARGNDASVVFDVLVRDTTAPAIDAPAIVVAEAEGPDGASVNYGDVATFDLVDGAGVALCAPASGGLFALGETVVACDAEDAAGNAATTATFTVRVVDTTPPAIAPPEDVLAVASVEGVAWVELAALATHDAVDGEGLATCDAATGEFPVGPTQVTCTATDAAGNEAAPVAFLVLVLPAPPELVLDAFDGPSTSTEDERVVFRARLRNVGGSPGEAFTTLVVDGEPFSTRRWMVAPGEEARVEHGFTPRAPGRYEVELQLGDVRIGPLRLDVQNEREERRTSWLVVDAPPAPAQPAPDAPATGSPSGDASSGGGTTDGAEGGEGAAAEGGAATEPEVEPRAAPGVRAVAPEGPVRSPATLRFETDPDAIVYWRVGDSEWRTTQPAIVGGDGAVVVEYYALGPGGRTLTRSVTLLVDDSDPELDVAEAPRALGAGAPLVLRARLGDASDVRAEALLTPVAGGDAIRVPLARAGDGLRAEMAGVPPGEYEVVVLATDAVGRETRVALAAPLVVGAPEEPLEPAGVPAAGVKGTPGVGAAAAVALLGLLALARRRR